MGYEVGRLRIAAFGFSLGAGTLGPGGSAMATETFKW